jgi:cytochrome c553
MVDLETLVNVYTTMKEYIQAKDRQSAADHIMSEMVDVLNDEDLTEFAAVDSYLKHAHKEYNFEEDEPDLDDEEE